MSIFVTLFLFMRKEKAAQKEKHSEMIGQIPSSCFPLKSYTLSAKKGCFLLPYLSGIRFSKSSSFATLV